jgi:hypothetical protein
MQTATITPESLATPVWVYVVNVAQALLLAAFLALAVYAGWKAFLWLRGWRPHKSGSAR